MPCHAALPCASCRAQIGIEECGFQCGMCRERHLCASHRHERTCRCRHVATEVCTRCSLVDGASFGHVGASPLATWNCPGHVPECELCAAADDPGPRTCRHLVVYRLRCPHPRHANCFQRVAACADHGVPDVLAATYHFDEPVPRLGLEFIVEDEHDLLLWALCDQHRRQWPRCADCSAPAAQLDLASALCDPCGLSRVLGDLLCADLAPVVLAYGVPSGRPAQAAQE